MAAKQARNVTAKQAIRKPIQTGTDKAGQLPEKGGNKLFSISILLALLLGVIAIGIYANTLKNGYVLDDSSAISENKIVMKGTSAITEILSTPYRRGYVITSNDLYRPLSLVVLAIEYQFFGADPKMNHLANILIYAGCVMMLFFFVDDFFERKKTAVAFIAALIFALHPIHTEVVANIKSSDELLCFFFAFLCLNVFLKYLDKGKLIYLLLGCFCFFLSLLSKETVFTFLAVIPLIFFFYRNENRQRGIYITIGSVITAGIFLWIRFSVLSAYDANHITSVLVIDNALAATNLSLESRMATAILILGKYMTLLFVPYPLICDYSYNTIPYAHFGNLWTIISLLVYISLGVYGIRGVLKNRKDPYAFAILFFLITISMFTNIPFLIGATMGERFMFFGSVGFCLAIALLIEKMVKTTSGSIEVLKSPKVLGVIIPLSLVYASITFGRNKDWADNYTLYKTDLAKAPNSARLNYFYGLELETTIAMNEKDPKQQNEVRKEGLTYLKKAIAIAPDFSDAQAGVGNTYIFFAQYDSAEVHEKRALELYPLSDKNTSNLAFIYYREKKFPQSIEFSKKAIELNPDYINPYTNLGRCYLSIGKSDSAVYFLHKAISVDPSNVYPYSLLANYYQSIGQADSMEKYTAIFKKYSKQ